MAAPSNSTRRPRLFTLSAQTEFRGTRNIRNVTVAITEVQPDLSLLYQDFASARLRWAEIGRLEGLELVAQASGVRRRGRPSKMGPETLSRFLLALRAGASRADAARFAGIAESTFYRWESRKGPAFDRFRSLVERAELEVKVEVTTNLYRLALRETRAALVWLRTRYPDEWPVPKRRAMGRA